MFRVADSSLPPSRPSCGVDGEHYAMITASSYHPGGVNVAFVDGSVHFVADSIDAGDPNIADLLRGPLGEL